MIDPLIAHALGDYVIQSDWMARRKTKSSVAALIHAGSYSLPFLLITRRAEALCFIVATHFVIDRWRLARFVVWVKNLSAPVSEWRSFADCAATGYPPESPAWMSVWLLIIADNALHVLLNAYALAMWP